MREEGRDFNKVLPCYVQKMYI